MAITPNIMLIIFDEFLVISEFFQLAGNAPLCGVTFWVLDYVNLFTNNLKDK